MKILVVDDHVLIRDALRSVLEDLAGEVEVFEAADAGQAAGTIDENPDIELALLDLQLPGRSGFELLAELRERHPAMSVVVLSVSNARRDITRALDLGALGFIPKSTPRKVMTNALKLVFAGGIYVPSDILGRAQESGPRRQGGPTRSDGSSSTADLGLTGRQLEVLALLMQGKSNKAIARALDVAEPTVKNHVTAILKALKVTNRTEAALAAGALGVAAPEDAG